MNFNDENVFPSPQYNDATVCARIGCQNPCLMDSSGVIYLFCSVACATLYQRDIALIRCRNPACLRQFCGDLVSTCPYCSSSSIPGSSRQQQRQRDIENGSYSISVFENSVSGYIFANWLIRNL